MVILKGISRGGISTGNNQGSADQRKNLPEDKKKRDLGFHKDAPPHSSF